ncbi:MAG: SMP-30/gluconolactonase/LRE family protein [Phycisphaerales bacterium]|nr:MAG: SMP-30/gluconolactonase/LRE family protein [Phycisphaerales bacterium]
MEIVSIGNPLCRLAESPVWNDTEKALYWTDIPARRIWRYDLRSGETTRAWEGDLIVGGFAFTGSNAIIMCTQRGVYKLTRPTGSLELLFDIPMAEDERFNDITTDPRGRIFAGTLTERRVEGLLYRLERGKAPEIVLRDIKTSNGMTFSLDLKCFYHIDSRIQTITRYDYDLASGDIENPYTLYQGNKKDGSPDGMTMDADGFLWVACYRGGKILRIDDQGKIVQELPVPAAQPSSVMFGGDGLDELFITSASEGAADQAQGLDGRGRYLGGAVFRVRPGVTGRREWHAGW